MSGQVTYSHTATDTITVTYISYYVLGQDIGRQKTMN